MAAEATGDSEESCPYSLSDKFGEQYLVNIPHQEGACWLTDVFSRTARRFPNFTALQIPYTGDSLTYAELDTRAENIAVHIAPFLTGPDQIVAVAMTQDNWQIVASHLAILKAGGVLMFLDTTLPDPLITHMLQDAQPVLILTRGQESFRDMPTLDVLELPLEEQPGSASPAWLDDPGQRLATLFYTSGTTGKPKGVESTHAGYVNLALSYADYFDLIPGMDATSLVSSLGYDGSISEMYSAWVSGCAVVLLTREQIRAGPGLLPVLCDAEVTVLFCPPVLLTTLTENPELDLPNPICRYIVPAGEAFPDALVEPWTRGRRQIINTYGPTEASTDTSRQSLRPGAPVTIGSPFANVTYVILQEGQLQALPHGEAGELCIGGVHVARGYRNLPEQTAKNFIDHPQFGRLYRTGDKCRIDGKARQVHFLGRIDTQLKVRGHRVEIQPVEDILQGQFEEIEAAVLDYQNGELVAFVCAPSISGPGMVDVAPAPANWASRVTTALEDRLPQPSVPDRLVLVRRFCLKPISGKIDRERLPGLPKIQAKLDPFLDARQRPDTSDPDPKISEGEPPDPEVLEICRDVFEAELDWDAVFTDHGGHSIVIAQLAQRLHASGWPVPVRSLLSDCDSARKVAASPRHNQVTSAKNTRQQAVDLSENGEDQAASRVLSPGIFSLLQAMFLFLFYSPALVGFLAALVFTHVGEFFMTATVLEFIAVGLAGHLFALTLPFAGLFWVMVIKLFMGAHPIKNRVTPGVYPKWSRMHLRVWCISRMQRSVLLPLGVLFRSAPLMAYALRKLGARVGKNLQCAHDADFSGPLDLLSIGDDVAIQTGAYLHTSRWQGQQLHIGRIQLESECRVEMRAAIAGGVTVGRGSQIRPFTPILQDVGCTEMWEGAPARLSGRCTSLGRTTRICEPTLPPWAMETSNLLLQVFLDFWLIVVPTAAVTWFAATFIPVPDSVAAVDYFKLTPLLEMIWHLSLYAFTTAWVSIVLVSLLTCLFLRFSSFSPGVIPTRSLRGFLLLYRIRKLNQVQTLWTWTVTGQYLRALAGMRFPRVGASECDVMFNLVPELSSADSQVFWSNGSFTSMADYGAEHIKLRQLDMPQNFFCGNNCVAEYGQYPSNFLLGVSTPGNDIQFRRQMRTRIGESITIAGNPPVKFASAEFDQESKTQTLPGLALFLGRIFLNDICGVGMLHIQGMLIFVVIYTTLLRMDFHLVPSAMVALVLSEAVMVFNAALIKKIFVGKNWGRNHSAPFWSWRHFSYFFAQDCFFAWCRRPLQSTAGTLFANTILRRMGCRIGKRTIISSPLQASDWNAVDFGDDCMVDGFLQLHTFENWLLKVNETRIDDCSEVNFGATVMGGACINRETTLLPLSLVLKQMHLPSGTCQGSPAEWEGK